MIHKFNQVTPLLRRWAALAGAVLCVGGAAPVTDKSCTNPHALGVARTLEINTAGGVHFGRFQYASTVPLGPREVVLTFDDGPRGALTRSVLASLAAECTKATFFMIGRNAAADPTTARAVALAGHTIGHHSMTHPAPMTMISPARAIADIAAGEKAVRSALGDQQHRFAPGFFRYPGLWNPPDVDRWLNESSIGVFGIDVHARDWDIRDPDELINITMTRLEQVGAGMLLLHDIQPVTVKALPRLLRTLKARGWHVVHLVEAKAKTALRPTAD